ncbi:MAG TPA: ABC transporter permease, partial [Longimicrobiaceae bacterium]|nr:ABC transporter permease [Longimicrobiaceae bacterium]
VGDTTLGFIASWGRFGGFLNEFIRAIPDVGTWAPLLILHMRRLGVDSLPIAIFLTGFTGIVLALQASYTFTGAIPLYFVGTLVGKTMMLELGPVLTGLALSGRVGANIAAELGTMRVSEQIDALETMAYNPVAYLVVPRVLAAVLMFPIVVAFGNLAGITAGWITAINVLDMSTQQFVHGLQIFYKPFDVTYSMIKSTSFGFVIAIIGCYQGFNTQGGAEGVGVATTRAVVISGMLILVLDAFWAFTLLN